MEKKVELTCPKCGKTEKQYKHGTTKKGTPRYRCVECKAVYSFDEPKYSEDYKKTAIRLYLEGNSGRAVGRIMGIGKNTIWEWLKKYEKNMDKIQENDVEIAEEDELYTYIKKREKEHT